MSGTRAVRMLYGKEGMTLRVPRSAAVLTGQDVPPLPSPETAVAEALANPIGAPPLRDLLTAGAPQTIAITISDITRSVPNRQFLPSILALLNDCGIKDSQIVIVIGTGMHRPSSKEERELLVGPDIPKRVEVIDHRADDPATLVRLSSALSSTLRLGLKLRPEGRPSHRLRPEGSDDPPVSICRRFVEADFRIVTGYIEPHFMAGFSGGRKGVCPALVDLQTIQRFHGYETLANPTADNGILDGNPCHEIALRVAAAVGVDFLFNVAINRDRRMAGIYCGDLEQAHRIGCAQVAEWAAAPIQAPFDLVVTNGGGYPLDQTFYQTVKGMCTALPALAKHSTLLQVSHCGQELGSPAYSKLLLDYDNDWPRFLADIAANRHETRLDQWEFQMQARVLARIGREKLWFVSDGIPADRQRHIAVTPILGPEDAQARAQRAIDEYTAAHPGARIAVIPEGPYTMLRPTEFADRADD